MTRDDIIRMAGKCGMWARSVVIMNDDVLGIGHPTEWPELEQFAALVAAAEREQVAAEVALALKVGMPHDMLLDAVRKRGAL